ncbi:hypothetical protein K458DRAFT_285523 [Lentithecium fluviatile CBS 122367]|uniref:DNA ligase D 3'-phosphoesterase domain-containing protein n=1 Tax=Lentithecium fluviatile CBS 122367 TaxID=1168545 RepID=A0A6G1JM31_9PLEO|nr:hypothetical protein K458DRAFT_285523 [Lentithecium fluviatile CBS 122367]
MRTPSSLSREISPPPRLLKRLKTSPTAPSVQKRDDATPTISAVEAGRAKVENHLAYFKEHLSKSCIETKDDEPIIDVGEWTKLYESCEHEHGNHFVVHQHNHPISGVHYDLRLQFSKTSSLSFALPKGLPGNPNSKSLGRMAIETRVHNLWNHLIESASAKTGSLLIWDTGTYTILPRKDKAKNPPSPQTTDGESDSESEPRTTTVKHKNTLYENEKLIEAFCAKSIRLRLDGTRLPKNYTVALRLPSANNFGKPLLHPHLPRKRRRRKAHRSQPQANSTDSETDYILNLQTYPNDREDGDIDTDTEESAQTRLNNAYPGSTNTIGSVHQRRWFMLLDRASSGFVQERGAGRWVRMGKEEGEGFETFFVGGRDYERSIVTGRLAREVESDEGVEGFVGRSGWMGVTD